MSNTEHINHELSAAQAFLDAMVPVLHVAERTDELLRRRMGTAFRIAKYTVSGEVSLNQILADLLNPRGAHGQGVAFLKLFVQMLPGAIWSKASGEWRVVPSHRTAHGRYVDVALFRANDAAIYIECKPWAGEGEEQLADYAKDLLRCSQQHKILVFVPGEQQRHPETLPEVLKQELGENGYCKIPFQRSGDKPSMIRWLERCAAASEASSVRLFIDDLTLYLRDKFGDEGEESMTEDPFISMLKDHVRENKDRLKVVLRLELLARQLRKEIPEQFRRQLVEELQQQMPAGWTVDSWDHRPGSFTLWLKKEQWPRGWGVALENQSAPYGEFLIGFACPNSPRHLQGGFAPLATSEDETEIRTALTDPLHRISQNIRQRVEWWPISAKVPDQFVNWDTVDTLILLSGLEESSDRCTALTTFVDWYKSLAEAAEAPVDRILLQHRNS